MTIVAETFGSGPPIIFAHGLTGNRHVTRKQFTPLANHYTIVIFDQRGHCDSTAVTDPALYDAEHMAADMAAVMDTLGIERAIVGGESMGSATTLMFALRWPERVEKLLLTAPAFGDKPNPAVADIQAMGEAIEEVGIDAFLAASAVSQRDELGWPPEVIQAVAEMQGSHETHSLATACKAVIDWTLFDDLNVLSALAMPVCIIAWDDDNLHPLSLAQRMAESFPNARLEMLPSLMALFLTPEIIGEIYGRFLESVD
ncbi:MAG: alpha/beta hydrolase [Chloroflexota bacterium]|nr:alpha/beta hydrolase [Chloroflexota bacterium]